MSQPGRAWIFLQRLSSSSYPRRRGFCAYRFLFFFVRPAMLNLQEISLAKVAYLKRDLAQTPQGKK